MKRILEETEKEGERKALVISFPLPEYTIDQKPNYALGTKVDELVKGNFDTRNIVVRAISLLDHPQFSLDELVAIILEKGTDKYDPTRKGVAHEEFEPYKVDFQASGFEIDGQTGSMFGGIMRNFYENAPIDRGYPLRIDLLIIYDRNGLVQADKVDRSRPSIDPRLEKYLFRFRDPEHKNRALLGIIKITR